MERKPRSLPRNLVHRTPNRRMSWEQSFSWLHCRNLRSVRQKTFALTRFTLARSCHASSLNAGFGLRLSLPPNAGPELTPKQRSFLPATKEPIQRLEIHFDATIGAYMNREKSRRTTLTLPSACLEAAERIARKRHLNLSSVIGEALERGLREEEQAQRSEAIVRAYSKAFADFSNEELLLLDGIVTEEHAQEGLTSEKRRVSSGRSRAWK